MTLPYKSSKMYIPFRPFPKVSLQNSFAQQIRKDKRLQIVNVDKRFISFANVAGFFLFNSIVILIRMLILMLRSHICLVLVTHQNSNFFLVREFFVGDGGVNMVEFLHSSLILVPVGLKVPFRPVCRICHSLSACFLSNP